MDGVTHAVAGFVAGAAAGDDGGPRRLFWTTVALSPDLDLLSGLGGPAAYYAYHRRVLHGLPGAALLAALGGLAWRRLGLGTFRNGVLRAGAAVGLHLFLDVVTSFGTSLLYPLSSADWSLDLLFIVDVVFTTLLVVAALAARGDGVGARRRSRLGLAAVVLYLGVALVGRNVARESVESLIQAGEVGPGVLSVIPQPPSVLHWGAFVVGPGVTWAGRVELAGRQAQFVPYSSRPPAWAPVAVMELPSVRRFLAFARFPEVRVSRFNGGTRFAWRDLRFALSGRERTNDFFGVVVDTTVDGRVLFEGLVGDAPSRDGGA